MLNGEAECLRVIVNVWTRKRLRRLVDGAKILFYPSQHKIRTFAARGQFPCFGIAGKLRALSSVGLERFLDMEKATGSNPVAPTMVNKITGGYRW